MRRNSRSTFERGAGVTLLVLGGSQGAVAINDAVLASIAQWKEQFPACRIIHQTGHADIHRVRKSYEQHKQNAVVEAFFPEMSGLYREADVVVSRAGATTLAELACAGCPAILIPYPRSVGDHQLANARWFARKGAAMVVEQAAGPTVTSATLAESLSRLLAEPARRDAMRDAMAALARPDAARDVVACIEPYIR